MDSNTKAAIRAGVAGFLAALAAVWLSLALICSACLGKVVVCPWYFML